MCPVCVAALMKDLLTPRLWLRYGLHSAIFLIYLFDDLFTFLQSYQMPLFTSSPFTQFTLLCNIKK